MTTIQEGSDILKKAVESGQIKPAPATPTAYPSPDPEPGFNPLSRGPLPASMWTQPDATRQGHAPAIPQTRVLPTSLISNPVVGSQAQSQAIIQIANTPAASSGITSVGLTAPSIFTVGNSPLSPPGGTISMLLAPEAQNFVFAGPPSSAGNVTLDAATGQSFGSNLGSGTQNITASVSVAAQSGEFALFASNPTDQIGIIPTPPDASWTQIFAAGASAGGLYWKVASGTSASASITVSGTRFVASTGMVTLKANGTPSIASHVENDTISNGGSSPSTISLSVTAGNVVFFIVSTANINGNAGAFEGPVGLGVTDSQGNVYTQLTNSFIAGIPHTVGGSQCAIAATIASATGTLTINFPFNVPSGLGGNLCLEAISVQNLGTPNFLPTFRLLTPGDIPNLPASIIASGQLALNVGGTAADLSATGGAHKFLSQASSGAAITVVQPDFSDLLGTAKISKYNAISTVSNGVPSEYATVDLTAQVAAITTTVLYTVPATGAGQYRVSWNAKVTIAGTTSTLGPLTLVYTDPDGTVQTITAAAQSNAGVIETSDTGNLTTTVLLGLDMLLNCKASTNITYAFAYASTGGTSMQYNLHIKLEAL